MGSVDAYFAIPREEVCDLGILHTIQDCHLGIRFDSQEELRG
jgi:hypothetical protein